MTAMQIIRMDYDGTGVGFTNDGWFNATEAASKYGKRPNDWLALHSTKEYLAVLVEALQISDAKSLIVTRRGGNTRNNGNAQGTWMHPKLAVAFARWLDVRFAVWCDMQIDAILRGQIDVKRLRSEAASSFKVMTSVLQLVREEQGKVTASHHYSNEARLINWALTGTFGSIDRNTLSAGELAFLAKLEEKNAVLIGRGADYETRKKVLEQYAIDLKGEKLLT